MPPLGPELLLLLILLIILFRPKTLTEIGRGLGKMLREFRSGESKERREKLIKIAKELGIDPEGKTEEEVLEEIRKKLLS